MNSAAQQIHSAEVLLHSAWLAIYPQDRASAMELARIRQDLLNFSAAFKPAPPVKKRTRALKSRN